MNSLATEKCIRSLDVMLGDMQGLDGSCVHYTPPSGNGDEPGFVGERYAIGVDGEMIVLQSGRKIPLSFQVQRGYIFYI